MYIYIYIIIYIYMYKNQTVAPTQLSEWRPAFRIEDWIEQWEVLNFPRQCVHNHTNFQLGSLAADIVFLHRQWYRHISPGWEKVLCRWAWFNTDQPYRPYRINCMVDLPQFSRMLATYMGVNPSSLRRDNGISCGFLDGI